MRESSYGIVGAESPGSTGTRGLLGMRLPTPFRVTRRVREGAFSPSNLVRADACTRLHPRHGIRASAATSTSHRGLEGTAD
jgi:hypothetical protein